MTLKMDANALKAFLRSDFPQVGEEFEIEHLDQDLLTVRLRTTEKHLRPGGTVSGPSMSMPRRAQSESEPRHWSAQSTD